MNNSLDNYIVRNCETGNILADCTTLSGALAHLDLMEQEDKENGTYEPNSYEIYDTEADEIVELYEYRCDKCGHICSDNDYLYPYKDSYYCDSCINELVFKDGAEEYCRWKQEPVELHGWDISFCEGCMYRNKCRIVEYFNDLEQERKKAASILGKLGGASKSPAKAAASRENGKLGGRPPRIRSIANACAAYIRSVDLTANISDGRSMSDNEYACYIWDQLEAYGLHRSDESIVRELAEAMDRAGLCDD